MFCSHRTVALSWAFTCHPVQPSFCHYSHCCFGKKQGLELGPPPGYLTFSNMSLPRTETWIQTSCPAHFPNHNTSLLLQLLICYPTSRFPCLLCNSLQKIFLLWLTAHWKHLMGYLKINTSPLYFLKFWFLRSGEGSQEVHPGLAITILECISKSNKPEFKTLLWAVWPDVFSYHVYFPHL